MKLQNDKMSKLGYCIANANFQCLAKYNVKMPIRIQLQVIPHEPFAIKDPLHFYKLAHNMLR